MWYILLCDRRTGVQVFFSADSCVDDFIVYMRLTLADSDVPQNYIEKRNRIRLFILKSLI
jgi:hypothetical protein